MTEHTHEHNVEPEPESRWPEGIDPTTQTLGIDDPERGIPDPVDAAQVRMDDLALHDADEVRLIDRDGNDVTDETIQRNIDAALDSSMHPRGYTPEALG